MRVQLAVRVFIIIYSCIIAPGGELFFIISFYLKNLLFLFSIASFNLADALLFFALSMSCVSSKSNLTTVYHILSVKPSFRCKTRKKV
jgi:hypothetical protein